MLSALCLCTFATTSLALLAEEVVGVEKAADGTWQIVHQGDVWQVLDGG